MLTGASMGTTHTGSVNFPLAKIHTLSMVLSGMSSLPSRSNVKVSSEHFHHSSRFDDILHLTRMLNYSGNVATSHVRYRWRSTAMSDTLTAVFASTHHSTTWYHGQGTYFVATPIYHFVPHPLIDYFSQRYIDITSSLLV